MIDGEYLSNLRFADDILICANTSYELQQLLQLAENQGLKMNRLKTNVMMENNIPIYVNNTQRTSKATSTWDRHTAPETKTKTRRFKVESRPDRQHSSRVTLEHV